MDKYHVVYQEIAEARVVIEARDEEHLADLMEIGDFELNWSVVGTYSEIEYIDYGQRLANHPSRRSDEWDNHDPKNDRDIFGMLLSELDEY